MITIIQCICCGLKYEMKILKCSVGEVSIVCPHCRCRGYKQIDGWAVQEPRP